MECEELKKIVGVRRAKISTKRMSCHPEFISFVLIQFMVIIFSFTRLLWQKMIYDISEFQKGNFQGSHKIFVTMEEKYRLIGWSWVTEDIVSLLAEIENIGERDWGEKYINILILRDIYGIFQWWYPGSITEFEMRAINVWKGKKIH